MKQNGYIFKLTDNIEDAAWFSGLTNEAKFVASDLDGELMPKKHPEHDVMGRAVKLKKGYIRDIKVVGFHKDKRKTYTILLMNCDCCSSVVAVRRMSWTIGPRCRHCNRILGMMQVMEAGKVLATTDWDATRIYRKLVKAKMWFKNHENSDNMVCQGFYKLMDATMEEK